MVDPLSYFSFQPVLHDWCNKSSGMCYPVCGMVHIKKHCCLSERVAHVAPVGFLSRYLNGPLPYVRHHITVTKVLSASLNKTLPSFLYSIITYKHFLNYVLFIMAIYKRDIFRTMFTIRKLDNS